MDKTIAHLGFIQTIISRMGSNSFLIKGWTVALVAALFALAAKDSSQKFFALAYFPTLLFWLLDGYYLHQEKLYRALYDAVASGKETSDLFTLNASPYAKNTPPLPSVILSKTILPFYGFIALLILVLIFK